MHVFAYGTLTDAARVSDVVAQETGVSDDDWRFVGDATLHGLHRVDGRYPTLAPGGRVDGRVVETTAVDAFDAYEGVDRGLYVRVPVPYATDRGRVEGDAAATTDATTAATTAASGEDEPSEVAVYVGDPDRLDATEPVDWPGTGPLADRVAEYVSANDVAVELD